jgi:hypothetical protein
MHGDFPVELCKNIPYDAATLNVVQNMPTHTTYCGQIEAGGNRRAGRSARAGAARQGACISATRLNDNKTL